VFCNNPGAVSRKGYTSESWFFSPLFLGKSFFTITLEDGIAPLRGFCLVFPPPLAAIQNPDDSIRMSLFSRIVLTCFDRTFKTYTEERLPITLLFKDFPPSPSFCPACLFMRHQEIVVLFL